METVPALGVFLFGLLVLGAGFFAASESALFSLGLYRVRRLKPGSSKSYQAAQNLLREPTRLISTLLVGNELLNAGISVLGSSIVFRLAEGHIDAAFLPFVAVAAILPLFLIFGEIIPKTVGVKHPELVASVVAVPLEWFSDISSPLRNILSWISERVLSLTGVDPKNPLSVSEDLFRSMVDTGTEEGVLDPHERRLIHNVFRLDDVRVTLIMTPRARVSTLHIGMTVKEMFDRFETEKYSRYPVLDASLQGIAGVLYVKDVLGARDQTPDSTIRPFVREPLVVLPDTNALELFVRFRSRRSHFALVRDETTKEFLGVVTLDDVLRVIFGELKDENDVEEEKPSKR